MAKAEVFAKIPQIQYRFNIIVVRSKTCKSDWGQRVWGKFQHHEVPLLFTKSHKLDCSPNLFSKTKLFETQ